MWIYRYGPSIRLLFLPAVVLFSGCGPILQYTVLIDSPITERSFDEPIKVYTTSTPSCDYEEIGRVRASNGIIFGGASTYVDAMRKKAREVGGDAILLGRVEPLSPELVEALGGEEEAPDGQIQTGIIIRFIDRECVE